MDATSCPVRVDVVQVGARSIAGTRGAWHVPSMWGQILAIVFCLGCDRALVQERLSSQRTPAPVTVPHAGQTVCLYYE